MTNLKFLSEQNYEAAATDCTTILSLDPVNQKALYRRAIAFSSMKNDDAAFNDIHTLNKLDGGDNQARKLCQKLGVDLNNFPVQPAHAVRSNEMQRSVVRNDVDVISTPLKSQTANTVTRHVRNTVTTSSSVTKELIKSSAERLVATAEPPKTIYE